MYTGRPLPRPPKLINFLSSSKQRNDGPAALDKSNEGKRKRPRRSGSQQQQQALDTDPSGELSENDIEKARGFDLLNQAADSMSNRHYPQHYKILHHSRQQTESIVSREKLQSSSSSSLEKDCNRTHASRWTEQAHSSTASSTEKMTSAGSGIKGRVTPPFYSSTKTSSSDQIRSFISWKQKRREELRIHHQHHVYSQGLWDMNHLLPAREEDCTLDTFYLLRMGQEVRSWMEKKK